MKGCGGPGGFRGPRGPGLCWGRERQRCEKLGSNDDGGGAPFII